MINKKYFFIIAFLLMFTMPVEAQTHHVDVDVSDVNSSTLIIDGIDVSDHQKVIDWEALATDKRIKYVYIKATEGVSFTSPSYRRNLEGAKRVGIKVGSYHFMRTGSRIQAQFENFARVVKKNDQDLIPLLDVETKKGWTNEQLRDSVRLFLNLLEDHYGVRPMIYTNAFYYNNLLGGEFADYPLFIARFAANEPVLCNAKWILWQFSETGRLPGIDHAVDLSRFNKGCSLRDISIKNNKIKSRNRTATEAVDKKDKPNRVNVNRSKEAPTMSKQQEKELKKQQEKERKARERAEKMAADEAKKQAETKKKQEDLEKKRKQQEAHEKARKKQEEEKKAKEQERIKKLQEADLKQKAKEADERRKAQEAEKAKQEKAKQEKAKQERNQRLKQQQEAQQKAKTQQQQKLQQQKQNAQNSRNKATSNVRQSTKSRTNKSSADND